MAEANMMIRGDAWRMLRATLEFYATKVVIKVQHGDATMHVTTNEGRVDAGSWAAASLKLMDRAAELDERAPSPTPAPAVDIEALEAAVTEAAFSLANKDAECRASIRGTHAWLELGDQLDVIRRQFDEARKALAEARKPAPKLMSLDEAIYAYESTSPQEGRGRWDATDRASMQAVLDAVRADAMAEIEALPEREVEVPAGDGEGIILCRSIEDIRRVLGGAS